MTEAERHALRLCLDWLWTHGLPDDMKRVA